MGLAAPRAVATGILLVVVPLCGACGILQSEPSPLVPGSQWRVASVGGEQVARTELALIFIGQDATLSSECGAWTSTVTRDADGQAVTFGEFRGPSGPPICDADAAELHERVADALSGAEGWERDGSAVELSGVTRVRLEPQRTDS